MSSATYREKHWSFSIYGADVAAVIAPVVERVYGNDERNGVRTEQIASRLIGAVGYGAIDFDHDPDAGDDAVITRSDVADYMRRLIDGYYDEHLGHDEVALVPLLDDGFAPLDTDVALIEGVADAMVTAVANGVIEVDANEPYDSCAGCGGYHNVNYDCSRDDEDDDGY